MPKKKVQIKKNNKEFYSLHPSLSYTEYADSKQLDCNATNIGYKSTLESLMKFGNSDCRKQARVQSNLFEARHNQASDFGKLYKQYWKARNNKENKTTSGHTARQLQKMANDTTINLAQMAWSNIQKETNVAFGTHSSNPSSPGSSNNDNLTLISTGLSNDPSSSSSNSHVNNNNDDGKAFEHYFHDINEAIDHSLNGIIDWTETAARDMAIEKFSSRTVTSLKDICKFKEYTYTPECKRLVERLSSEDKSTMGWRNELLKNHEFIDQRFDPLENQDWAFVKFIAEHFLRFMEAPTNPLLLPLAERTAASYTIQPIFNHLFLPYAHLFHTKWIEVTSDFTENTKIDGIGILKDSREIVLIIEFAGGNVSSSLSKFNSDVKKIYETALKSIKLSGKNKIFTVLYFNNSIYFEVLIKFKNQYVRYKYTTVKCPVNPPELQQFVKDTKIMFAWVRDLAAFAKTVV